MTKQTKDEKKIMGKGLQDILKQEGTLQQQLEFIQKDAKRNKIYVPIHQLVTNPFQTPKIYNAKQISELALSIVDHGILLPILVRQNQGRYEIISGEKRWRAAIEAKLTEVPVIIENIDDHVMKEISLIEQLQSDDITPLEEAKSYQNLIEQYGYSHQSIAKQIGKSRTYVTNLLRITRLPEDVLDYVNHGKISISHVRPLVGKDPQVIRECVQKIVDEHLSVRACENLLKMKKSNINIQVTSKQVIIDYHSEEELARILRQLQVGKQYGKKHRS